ncbi:cytidine and deoxycytidylate deaminase zinc-binding region domain-containing protein [Cystoisospora suis]|uniref:dCMP deaminase n=1 Tax=Cystoisospora suis TaxID=483139 RepID=A0A2C6KQL3_9APIC|nr:cytidine and deoxycytidylate deaminase zinc-binding region domain-containing protein [Cystoisospora suis]
MVVLGIVGPPQSGKKSLAYLLRDEHRFTILHLHSQHTISSSLSPLDLSTTSNSPESCSPLSHKAFAPPCVSSPPPTLRPKEEEEESLLRSNGEVEYTKSFQENAKEKKNVLPLEDGEHGVVTNNRKGGTSTTEAAKRSDKRESQSLSDPSQNVPPLEKKEKSSSSPLSHSCSSPSSSPRVSLCADEESYGLNGTGATGLHVSRCKGGERGVPTPDNAAGIVTKGARTKGCTQGLREDGDEDLHFSTAEDLLDFITRRWLDRFVVLGITSMSDLRILRKRPFFAVVAVDAPLGLRARRRALKEGDTFSLKKMIEEEDEVCYGSLSRSASLPSSSSLDVSHNRDHTSGGKRTPTDLPSTDGIRACMAVADVHLLADGDLNLLRQKISFGGLWNDEIVRPSWDTYFMRLTFLASTRSNCMKRRVGALVVRGNRVVATGYNGTPSQAVNCNEGGCRRCKNPDILQGQSLETCECIHAEANALLEAGMSQGLLFLLSPSLSIPLSFCCSLCSSCFSSIFLCVCLPSIGRDRAMNGTLYVTTLPCLGCAKLVVQSRHSSKYTEGFTWISLYPSSLSFF